MTVERRHITGFSNPTVKALRALREKKHRKAAGRFLAEGLRLLTDARECGHVPEVLVLADRREPHPLLAALEASVAGAGGEIIETTPDILAKITGKDNPQAVAGVFAEFGTALEAIERETAEIWLVAQALRDPGNLGTMLRTGDAIGAGGLILIDDCADPFSVEAVRASMGAIFTQRIAQARWDEFEPWLRCARPVGRGQPARCAAVSRSALCRALLRHGGQRIARIAGTVRNGLRLARDHADEGPRRQPQCCRSRGGSGV